MLKYAMNQDDLAIMLSQPEQAKRRCATLVFEARRMIAAEDMLSAAHQLLKACQIADLLLELDADQARCEIRFVNAITELAMLYRVLQRHRSLMKLIKLARISVRRYAIYYSENDLMRGISATCDYSEDTVNKWSARFQLQTIQPSSHQLAITPTAASACKSRVRPMFSQA
ncbi:MAG: hypothetical protein HRU21_04935 [Pseudomonadales bacterium]|nr:hypothetical protein [Pseudomonadales bacterium]